jgi:hypothetical protein
LAIDYHPEPTVHFLADAQGRALWITRTRALVQQGLWGQLNRCRRSALRFGPPIDIEVAVMSIEVPIGNDQL